MRKPVNKSKKNQTQRQRTQQRIILAGGSMLLVILGAIGYFNFTGQQTSYAKSTTATYRFGYQNTDPNIPVKFYDRNAMQRLQGNHDYKSTINAKRPQLDLNSGKMFEVTYTVKNSH